MADARDFYVELNGAPLLGGAAGMSALARDVTGATRTAPAIVELGSGVYRVVPTDADETAGTVVLVDTGAGNEPRRVVVECFKPDNSNQFWAVCVENADATVWTGTAPTVGSYRSNAGARTAPTLVAVEAAYLFVAVPTAGDVTADTAIRIDGPASSAQPYWTDSTLPLVSGIAPPPTLSPSPGIGPEQRVVEALTEYWRRYLPAKVTQLNLLRASVLKSALAGPFTIPVGAALRLSAVSQESSPTSVALPSGSVTAAAIAAAINLVPVPGLTASADEVGRLVLAAAAPSTGAPSVVVVARDSGPTGSNVALGWAEGGEHVQTSALVAPSWRGVVDGRAMTAPDMGQGFWVFLGNRTVRPTHPGVRRNTFNVVVQCEVWRPFSAHAPPHRTREGITACVRACRELVLTEDGRYLGRQGAGDVQLADVSEAVISGDPINLSEVPGVLFDWAKFTFTCRVFQRPE
jgi:hypothetical protein